VLIAQGRLADARVVLEELATGRGRLIPVVHAHLAEVLARTGDGRAAAAADHARTFATRAGATKEIAQAHRALGIALGSTGDAPSAAAHFAEALRRYQDLGTRWEVAQTLRDWGRAELESEDSASRDRARAMLGGARAIFQEIGDGRSADDARTILD
jgi:hypothetical protein